MGEFKHLGSTTNDKLTEWKKKAPWYRPDALRKALTAVVADSNTKWMARTGAIEAIAALGATKADLQALRTPMGADPKGDDMHVAKALDKAIAAAK